MIAETVTDERMPPWHAAPGHALFGNDRGMSSEEKEILVRWAEAGASRNGKIRFNSDGRKLANRMATPPIFVYDASAATASRTDATDPENRSGSTVANFGGDSIPVLAAIGVT